MTMAICCISHIHLRNKGGKEEGKFAISIRASAFEFLPTLGQPTGGRRSWVGPATEQTEECRQASQKKWNAALLRGERCMDSRSILKQSD
jgi:hypothetical protein